MTLLSTGGAVLSVAAIVCRKCGKPYRATTPLIATLRGRVDREVRCPSCHTLAAIWSSSTGS